MKDIKGVWIATKIKTNLNFRTMQTQASCNGKLLHRRSCTFIVLFVLTKPYASVAQWGPWDREATVDSAFATFKEQGLSKETNSTLDDTKVFGVQ